MSGGLYTMDSDSVKVNLSQLEKAFEVTKIEELKYRGVTPLRKPLKQSRGVYGGNLCGQSILVAMETVPQGFTPHSLHSYFVKAGDSENVVDYEVDKISDGNNFANRLVKAYQKGVLKYVAMISLTKRNSVAKAAQDHEKDPKKPSPFQFQRPPTANFYEHRPHSLKSFDHYKGLEHKLPPNFSQTDEKELPQAAANRALSFWIRADDTSKDVRVKYAGLGVVTDSLYLTSLSRVLHLPGELGPSGSIGKHFFSVSLDHSIYFHDDGFDLDQWLYLSYTMPRFSNNRVLIEGGYYNEEGKLIASIVQEGLVFFRDGYEHKAKL